MPSPFSPTGQLLASAAHDGKLRLFDLVKNALAKDINAHISVVAKQNVPNPIYSLTFSPDGKQILTISYDNSLKLWDVAGGNMIREFKPFKEKEFVKGHQEPVYSAAFSPDGKFIASGSSGLERTIKIWNLGDGSVARDLVNPNFKTAPSFPPASHPGAIQPRYGSPRTASISSASAMRLPATKAISPSGTGRRANFSAATHCNSASSTAWRSPPTRKPWPSQPATATASTRARNSTRRI